MSSLVAATYGDELLRQALLLSAAGLGGCFAILYRLTADVADATHDEAKNVTVLASVVLSLISGMILAQFLPVGEVGELGALTKPTLALLGGFSASLVLRILDRLVEAVGTLFAGSTDDRVKAVEEQARADVRTVQTSLARDLLRLKSMTPAAMDPELDKLIDRLTSSRGFP